MPSEKTKFDVSFYNFVNEQIDVYGDRTPPLRAFILPVGNAFLYKCLFLVFMRKNGKKTFNF